MKDDLQVMLIIMNHINQCVEIILRKLSENEKVFNNIEKELEELKAEKSGEWVFEEAYDHEYYTCSNCRESFILIDGTILDNNYNYCPNCGAKMKERE